MRTLLRSLIVSMLLTAAAVALVAPGAATANPVNICIGQPIPAGRVVISQQTNWVCGGASFNQYRISR
ncbi:hypothetical protein ACI2K4_26605 [Micromonospora sp. NPDC050397]|uniref:hypothetical protein n=1 Tax=Micromonospora sp. NPDC050397 TaxID=3364279 RepID=UPI00385141DE